MKSILLSGLLVSQTVYSAVIVNDAALIATPVGAPFFGDYTLTLTQSIPAGQGSLLITLSQIGIESYGFELTGLNIYSTAEEFRLFLPSTGAVFDSEYVSTHTPAFTNAAPADWVFFLHRNESLTVAYWDDRTPSSPLPAATDNFGWMRIASDGNGNLSATAGATAIGGGIIVGTNTQVPEPAGTALASFGLIALSVRRFRK